MDKLVSILYVAGGGAVGSVLRYIISQYLPKTQNGFPYGTFTVNIIGSFLIGLIMGIVTKTNNNNLWLIGVVGFCGGFTTFSAISYEGFNFIKQQQFAMFLSYFAISILLGVTATWLGYLITK